MKKFFLFPPPPSPHPPPPPPPNHFSWAPQACFYKLLSKCSTLQADVDIDKQNNSTNTKCENCKFNLIYFFHSRMNEAKIDTPWHRNTANTNFYKMYTLQHFHISHTHSNQNQSDKHILILTLFMSIQLEQSLLTNCGQHKTICTIAASFYGISLPLQRVLSMSSLLLFYTLHNCRQLHILHIFICWSQNFHRKIAVSLSQIFCFD